MNVEIERKFLVLNDEWRKESTRSVELRDGLLAWTNGRKVRVRACGETATLTVKGSRHGLERDEFEYAIPLADAEVLLSRHCDGNMLEKTRYYVPYLGNTWEVDVYHGLLAGIVTAELELSSSDATFARPNWIGEEVTFDERYSKINIFNQRLGAAQAKALEVGA